MGFKSILKAFRAAYKPGLAPGFLAGGQKDFATYENNQNADPLCDPHGVQWFRDANAPVQFDDPSNPLADNGAPGLYKQQWDCGLAVDTLFIGQRGGLGLPCALFKLTASFGDPAIPWATSPYYLQVHYPNNGVAVPGGRAPQFVIPAPRGNEGLGQAFFDFGIDTPLNCVSAGSGGAAIVFSVTPNNYTSPGGVLGQINANWAFYNYNP